MSIFLNKTTDCEGILGIWKIIESFDDMYQAIFPFLNSFEKETLNEIRNKQRKIEWIATRLLLMELLGKYYEIHHDIYGKPFIRGEYNISLSHSKDFVAIVLNRRPVVGIDIQHMSGKIAKVALRFLNPEEYNSIDQHKKIQHLYANWCAKETLLKIYGKKLIDFKKNILIPPFKFTDEGRFWGRIEIESIHSEYLLNYMTLADPSNPEDSYMLVWYCE